MFQYTWFDKASFTKEIRPRESIPDEFILPKDIDSVQGCYYGEHCLECAVPLCYGNCEYWKEREDRKCRKFYYGIYDNPNFPQFAYAAQMRFYEWAKLWSRVYTFSEKLSGDKKRDLRNKRISLFIRKMSRGLRAISPTFKLSGGWEWWIKNILAKKQGDISAEWFLFQAYVDDEEAFNLFIDVSSEKGLRMREQICLKKGYNQQLIPIKGAFSFDENNLQVAIYPENNYHAELVILMADFVNILNDKFGTICTKAGHAEKVKCVAWDLDQTIWNGILMESDPEKLKLREGILPILNELDQRGIINVVVSKNSENEALKVLERLDIKDFFVGWMINWNPKSSNIEALADAININIDTFAFIDDSPFERNEVAVRAPKVRVYDEKIIGTLLSLPEFDVIKTADGSKRRRMYQEEFQRRKIRQKEFCDTYDFLRACKLVITIRKPITDEQKKRGYELVQRTNQLNLSGRKYSEKEFDHILEDRSSDSFVMSAKDRYGEYGQIAYIRIERERDSAVVTEFAMSCRVAGKCIEHAVILWIMKEYQVQRVVFKGINTKKNHLLIKSLSELGMENNSDDEDYLYLMINRDKEIEHSDIVSIVKVSDR